MKLPLRIMSLDFQLIDEVDEYTSLQITRSWHGLGSIELRINRYVRGANELLKGRVIFPHNHLNKAYIIRHREIELDENGKASENWVIKALPLKSWLGQRITYPPSHTAYDNVQSNAETVLRRYVSNNVINPSDVDRRMDDIILSDNLNRGPTISWQSRYKNLAEELAEISLLSGLGWNVEIGTTNKRFVFKVLEGRDLSVNQSDLPPAIFSPEFNTLGQLSYTESDLNYKNFAVVAGQGEGVDRRVINVGEASGFDRYELFVDARDVEEEDEDDNPIPVSEIEQTLRIRGQQNLQEHEQEVYLEGQALMGRVTEHVPTEIKGNAPNATITDLEGFFFSHFQTYDEIEPFTINLEPINLSNLGEYRNSHFDWTVDEPGQSMAIVEWSLDNVTYKRLDEELGVEIDSGEPLINKLLYIRFRLITRNREEIPSINGFSYTIKGTRTRETVSTARLQYEKDYDLGDVVTLQNKEWGVTLDTRITEIKEIFESNGMKIELVFGNNRPTLIDKIKQELNGMNKEITR